MKIFLLSSIIVKMWLLWMSSLTPTQIRSQSLESFCAQSRRCSWMRCGTVGHATSSRSSSHSAHVRIQWGSSLSPRTPTLPPPHKPGVITEDGCFSSSQVVLVVKNPPANAGDVGAIPGSGRSHGQRNLQATVHGVAKSQTDMMEQLSTLKSHPPTCRPLPTCALGLS